MAGPQVIAKLPPAGLKVPPAINTRPPGSRVAVGLLRPVVMMPAEPNAPLFGSCSSADASGLLKPPAPAPPAINTRPSTSTAAAWSARAGRYSRRDDRSPTIG